MPLIPDEGVSLKGAEILDVFLCQLAPSVLYIGFQIVFRAPNCTVFVWRWANKSDVYPLALKVQ